MRTGFEQTVGGAALDWDTDYIPYLPKADLLRQPKTRLEEDVLIASRLARPRQVHGWRPKKKEEPEQPWKDGPLLPPPPRASESVAHHGPLCRWSCGRCNFHNSIFHQMCMLCQTERDVAESPVTCLCVKPHHIDVEEKLRREYRRSIELGVTSLTGHALSQSGVHERLQRLTHTVLPHFVAAASSLEVAGAALGALVRVLRRALNAPHTACVLGHVELGHVLHAPGGAVLLVLIPNGLEPSPMHGRPRC